MKPGRAIAFAAAAVAAAATLSVTDPAFADGKGNGGCASGGWTLATYLKEAPPPAEPEDPRVGDLFPVGSSTYDQRTHDMLVSGVPLDSNTALAIEESVDKNNDDELCYKLPSGWTDVPPANKAGLLSLTDNK